MTGLARRRGARIVPPLLGMLLYAVTLVGTYVYDDIPVVAQDPRVTDPALWGRFFTESYNGNVDNLWRPVASFSFAIQAQIHGASEGAAVFFHAMNVLLYGGVIALVQLFAARLSDWRIGAVVGLLFAAHPVHVEAVAGLVGRAELLCGLGMFGALALLVADRPLTWWRSLSIAGLTLLSVGAKEQGLVLPALFVAWALLRRQRPWRLAGCVGVPLLAYLIYREMTLSFRWDRSLLDPAIQPLILADGRDRWLIPVALLGRATQLLLAPWALSLDYGMHVITPRQSLADPYLWLGVATLALWSVGLGVALAKRHAAEAFALLGLAIGYLPASNGPTVIGTIFGERLLFLPSAFFILYLCLLARRLPPRVATGLLAVALLAGSAQTLRYALLWTDRLALYEHQADARPESVRSWLLLADGHRLAGDLDRAADAARRATDLAPEQWRAWEKRATIARERGRVDEAESHARKVAELRGG